MSFLHTIWLWGLLTLLIPIIIHFWNRQKSPVMPFGSLRFLMESASNKSKNIQFNDLWLFLIRLLLLLVFILFLAGLLLSQELKKEQWFILGEGVSMPSDFKNSNYQLKLLSTLRGQNEFADTWSFLTKLGQENPQVDSVLWVDNFEDAHFIGEIPSLPFHIQFVDKGSSIKDDQMETQSDTLNYTIEGLIKSDSILIERMLKTILAYTNDSFVFNKSEHETDLVFGTERGSAAEARLSLVFLSNAETAISIAYSNEQKHVILSSEYLRDDRKHQELLLIIAELVALEKQPLKAQAVANMQDVYIIKGQENESLIAKTPIADDFFIVLIILLLVLERFVVYRKYVANG